MKRFRGVVTAAISIACFSCGDSGRPGPEDPALSEPDLTINPPAGIVVSDAMTRSNQVNAQFYFSVATAYISAAPGTFPNGTSVSINNVSRNIAVGTAPIVNGGFDPVSISAAANEELSLTVSNDDGTIAITAIKVPPRRPPRVVRTNPSTGRTDVALNVQVEVVFTEPMDKSTITTSSMRLTRNGQPVDGSIMVSDDGLRATFIPDRLLDPNELYTFVVEPGIRDVSGDAIGVETDVGFTTGAEVTSGQSIQSGFDVGTYDLTAQITMFDPAWGDLTSGRYTATLTFPPGGIAGTWENMRFVNGAGESKDVRAAGTISTYRDFANRIVDELIPGAVSFVLVKPVKDPLDPSRITGEWGCCGHIAGNFLAVRRQ